jgi:nitrogen fixation protein FixH
MTPSSVLRFNDWRPGLRRFLPHWVPMMFIAGFMVVIGVNATLIFFAQDTFSGLDTASPYERGLDYNNTLAAEAAQERLGWDYQASISGGSGTERTLQIQLSDHEGRPLNDLTLQAYLVRPSSQSLDLTIAPRPAGDGSYAAVFALPAPGQWELRVVARGKDVAWQHSERLFVK